MEKRKLKIYINLCIYLFVLLAFQGCTLNSRRIIKVCKGYDYDSTYYIINDSTNDTLYFGGHNIIKEDTLIDDNIIFVEDITTEECSDRIIIYDSRRGRLFIAYNMAWLDYLRKEDLDKLLKGMSKPYAIKDLDITNRELHIRFFNDSLVLLKMVEETFE